MRASGIGGELRFGYQVAAEIGAWAIEPQGASFALSAALRQEHAVWIRERPLDVAVRLGPVTWKWKDVDPVVDSGQARLALTRRPDSVE